MNNTELNKLLLVLNIVKDITDISLKEVNNAFRKQVKLIHPDKSGDENTEKCQRLIDAYKKLKEYFKINGADSRDIIESDIEEKFFRENFEDLISLLQTWEVSLSPSRTIWLTFGRNAWKTS